jgi:hypothetical protein
MARKKLSESALKLQQYLVDALAPQSVTVRFNRNRSTYLSAHEKDGSYCLSVHEVFVEAPDEIWHLLARFFTRATKKVRFEIESYIHALPKEVWAAHVRKPPTLDPVGAVHDLEACVKRAIELGFAGVYPREIPGIGYSTHGSRKSRSISRLGTYDEDAHQIRISQRLDDCDVPFDFVVAVVFHELLHGVHRPQVNSERQRRVHTPEFLKDEKKYPHYEWSRRWEKEYLEAVLKKQSREQRRMPLF